MKLDSLSPTSVKKLLTRIPKGDPEECWPCLGCKTSCGYGRGSVTLASGGSTNITFHRLAYLHEYGEIPNGLHVLHRCDNPPCCNPAHLFLGTNDENMADKIAKGRQSRLSGEAHGRAVLTRAQVDAIRSDCRPYREIANDYAVGHKHISRIQRNKAWRSL